MIGILSDAHGNVAAFEKGWDVLTRHGARRFVFLGDAVGYIPGWQVVDALMERRDEVTCVLGNHEQMVLENGPSPHEDVYRHDGLRSTMTANRRAFLERWHRSLECPLAGVRALLVHGSPTDTQNGYIYPDTDLSQFDVSHDIVVSGHTHRPFLRTSGPRRFVNAGSCGLPRDDGRWGSAVLIGADGIEISILRYDIQQETEAALHAYGPVHSSVTQLLARRADQPIGEFVND